MIVIVIGLTVIVIADVIVIATVVDPLGGLRSPERSTGEPIGPVDVRPTAITITVKPITITSAITITVKPITITRIDHGRFETTIATP